MTARTEALGLRPVRVQLARTKGWRLPPGAVSVARPTRWGNPYRVVPAPPPYPPWAITLHLSSLEARLVLARYADLDTARRAAVDLYRTYLTEASLARLSIATDIRTHLAGRPLACWCPPDAPCHGDVLLEVANPTT